MTPTVKRLLIVASGIWLVTWAYVGWRGYQLASDAESFINLLPAGAVVPPAIFTALDAGHSYLRDAVIWGAGVPLGLLLCGWVLRPSFGRRLSLRR